jgi:hypothetical protein
MYAWCDRLLNSMGAIEITTWKSVHYRMEFIDLMLAVFGAVAAGFGVVLMIHEWRSLDSFRGRLRSSNKSIS